MTLREIKHMQAARRQAGEAYKPSEQRRAELRQTMKVWDLDDEFAWAKTKPWWLRPLQVLGAIAIVTGLVVLTKLFLDAAYYSILIVLSL